MIFSILLAASAFGGSPNEASQEFWTTPNQCAAWAAVQAAQLCGRVLRVEDANRLLPPDGRPKSLLDVQKALASVGVSAFGTRFVNSELPDAVRPMIVPIRVADRETLHFILLLGGDAERALYVDGPRDPQWVSRSRLRKVWTGEALELGEPPTSGRWLAAAGAGLLLIGGFLATRWRTPTARTQGIAAAGGAAPSNEAIAAGG